jgi:hypothetical protein
LGPDYSVFPTVGPTKIAYVAGRAAASVRCPMSGFDEELFNMLGGLVVFAVFCIAALLVLG